MNNWNDYGKVISSYKGTGKLHFDLEEANCEFELVQLADGRLYALCQFPDYRNAISAFNKEPKKLVGKTKKGQIVTFSKNLLITSLRENNLLLDVPPVWWTGS